MHTSLFKTSLYTRSLLANPPAALPQIPTLAELRERTEAMPMPLPVSIPFKGQAAQTPFDKSSWSSLPKSLLPTYSNGSPPPEYEPPTCLKNSFKKMYSTECPPVVGMKGSRGYVMDGKDNSGRQPEIDQVDTRNEAQGWISWLTCRG